MRSLHRTRPSKIPGFMVSELWVFTTREIDSSYEVERRFWDWIGFRTWSRWREQRRR